ncbi:phage major capsid protein [Clostridium butyricum]|uniref:phage major capsid protein n=1 Tax=Clostridium butyricum TaxID=1492 RepID=UPI002ABE0BA5|nr:phage major capsid protein [Clostridium butyricum]
MNKAKIKRIIERRSLPPLLEKRNDIVEKMQQMMEKADKETRALNEEEIQSFNDMKKEIDNIDATLKADEEARSYIMTPSKKSEEEEKRSLEETNFLKFVRGEQRALGTGSNGGIIPTTIAAKIIEKVKELSPIYAMTTIFNVKGDLVFPIYDEGESSVKAKYVEDFEELTEGTGKFKTVKLSNYIVGCLAKVSKSLMNRSDFDLLGYIVDKVAQAISEFIEGELIGGTEKMCGLETCENVVISNGNAINADDLIDLQMEVPEIYQEKAVWMMNKKTFKSIRKLKDSDGDYLLSKDLAAGFGWQLLGKHVHVTESCNEIAPGEKVIFYGDMSGLYVKLTKNVELQMLLEKYATQHAVGVCAYVELDSKIVETQKIVALQIKGEKATK